MESCILELPVGYVDRDLYDPRYFYQKETWKYSCVMACQTLMLVYHRHQFSKIQFDEWFKVICRSRNPIIQGFLMEQLCLVIITHDGLHTIAPTSIEALPGSMETEFFLDEPNWGGLINSTDHTGHLYLPEMFNYPNVDGAILCITNRPQKKAHLYPIQITLAKGHKDSETCFYEGQWPNWVKRLTDDGWVVESTFVWIDRKPPMDGVQERRVWVTSSGEHELNPDHYHWQIGFQSIDARFERLNSLA